MGIVDCLKVKPGSVISSENIEGRKTSAHSQAWSTKSKSFDATSNKEADIVPVYGSDIKEQNKGGFKEMEIRDALLDFEKWKYCSGKLSNEMDIKSITMSEGHIYKAQAIIEHRKSELKVEPYKPGIVIDGTENGPAPSIWSIVVKPPTDFKFKSKKDKSVHEIPHTAFTTECDHCHKDGYVPCHPCKGTGIDKCSFCHGNGFSIVFDEKRNCSSCRGQGKKDCFHCNGLGRQTCRGCAGSGSLKKYQALSVDWKVLLQNYDSGALLEKQLKKVTGKESVFTSDDCELKTNPLVNFYDEGIKEISESALQKFGMETGEKNDESTEGRRIIRVQQTVITISIAEVIGIQNEKMATHFYVFGNERKVYFPNGYPGGCCCCSIV